MEGSLSQWPNRTRNGRPDGESGRADRESPRRFPPRTPGSEPAGKPGAGASPTLTEILSVMAEIAETGPASVYVPAPGRYEQFEYRRCGRSGLVLPPISLGLWQNFGDDRPLGISRAILRRAFDLGITHFDLANNYGPPVRQRRDQLRADLRRGLRPSARRAGDLHQGRLRHVARSVRRLRQPQVPAGEPRPEPGPDGARLRRHLLFAPLRPRDAAGGDDGRAATPPSARARRATSASPPTGRGAPRRRSRSCAQLGTPLLIHQPSYSMFNRWIEAELLDVLEREGVGCIAFSPLAQGLLTDKYLDGVPEDSRVRRGVALLRGPDHAGEHRAGARPERDRPRARPDAGADGDRLGAARSRA